MLSHTLHSGPCTDGLGLLFLMGLDAADGSRGRSGSSESTGASSVAEGRAGAELLTSPPSLEPACPRSPVMPTSETTESAPVELGGHRRSSGFAVSELESGTQLDQ